jgi:hypothetical protein
MHVAGLEGDSTISKRDMSVISAQQAEYTICYLSLQYFVCIFPFCCERSPHSPSYVHSLFPFLASNSSDSLLHSSPRLSEVEREKERKKRALTRLGTEDNSGETAAGAEEKGVCKGRDTVQSSADPQKPAPSCSSGPCQHSPIAVVIFVPQFVPSSRLPPIFVSAHVWSIRRWRCSPIRR